MNYVEELLIGKCGFYCGSCPTYIKGQCSGCVEGQQVGDSRENGCVEFASDCVIDNTDSLQFHLRVGFEEAGRYIHFVKRL